MDFSPLFFVSSNCVLFKFEHAANTQGAAQQEDTGMQRVGSQGGGGVLGIGL